MQIQSNIVEVKNFLTYILILVSLASCSVHNGRADSEVDSLLYRAYRLRYSDVDSTRKLVGKALQLSDNDDEDKARAYCLEAFVRYHDMDYDGSLAVCDTVSLLSHNQVVLLCSDVMRMKVCQRIGDGRRFYESRSSASRRLKRIEEELDQLTDNELFDYHYAQSEYHIISSTYYYYQDEDSLAKAEMNLIDVAQAEKVDTTQWLNYLYMMGSGGLVDGTYEEIAFKEFDYLVTCYAMAIRANVDYFAGNALQALASRLKTDYDRKIIREHFTDAYGLLFGQHFIWLPPDAFFSEGLLPMALANHALSLFQDYGDLFQTACVYRTIGELAFDAGNYEESLHSYESALDCVNRHHQLYYPDSHDVLMAFNPNDTSTVSAERRWIEDETIQTVPEWIAGIRQQLSMTYSALDQKQASDYNRNIYLDILESTTQNREMESRMRELEEETSYQHIMLWTAACLLALLVILIVCFFMRLKPHQGTNGNARIMRSDKNKVDEMSDHLVELEEAYQVSRIRIAQNKVRNAEKRAKVSLVQAVTPFLDRIINEVSRMKRRGQVEDTQLQYIVELTDQIVEYNDILTEWIQMERGQLALQISTVDLSELFSIIEGGHYAFDQQGVKFSVEPTNLQVKADKSLTLFMLNTLADNARKFTPAGGTVTVSASEGEGYVELSVSDTGCGIKPEDVDTIVNSKVYDASQIGDQQTSKGKKGFGFGLMNCKGIVEKYKKASKQFNVCTFGIDSEVGKGSRFYFRLPRVMVLAMAFLCTLCLRANGNSDTLKMDNLPESVLRMKQYPVDPELAQYYYQLAYESNVEGLYENAIAYADTALFYYNPSLDIVQDQIGGSSSTNELNAFRQGELWDYYLLINLRNEIAVSALAVHDWDMYNFNNRICIQLHKFCNQDTSLPTYCDNLQQTKSITQQVTVLLVLISFIAIILIFMLFRGRRRKAENITSDIQSQIDQQQDILSHSQYEEARLHVQNQVLDNCLSTIKHESMYYPSRIRQLVSNQEVDIQQLDELASYYKQMYTILSSQAERQTVNSGLRRERVELGHILGRLPKVFSQMASKKGLAATLSLKDLTDAIVRADETMLDELFKQLFTYFLSAFPNVDQYKLSTECQESQLRVTIESDSISLAFDDAHELFYPNKSRIPLLIVKQIIRDIDAMNNNPGLRLIASEHGIWFTLPLSRK